jgi:leader peptidase (prepilin peptidase) / N-methyltransferase
MVPTPLLMVIAALVGAVVGLLVDRYAVRWQPPTKVAAAMGAVDPPGPTATWEWLPVVGWLVPLARRQAVRLPLMRAATEAIGAVALASLVVADLDPLRLALRVGLVAVMLLILRLDWQFHLIDDRMIVAGVVLGLANAASYSTGHLIGAALAGVGAAAAFLLFYLLARVIYGQAALGFGDVLLAGLIGVAVGPTAVLGTLLFGMIFASLGGLLVSLGRRSLRTYFAYGSYLAIATILVLAFPTLVARLPGFF